jgi:hypothetical protein
VSICIVGEVVFTIILLYQKGKLAASVQEEEEDKENGG